MTPHHPTTPPAAEGMLSHEPKFITCFLCGLQQRASTYYKNHLKACTVAWVEEERLLVAELVNGDFGPDNGLRPEVSRRAVVLPTATTTRCAACISHSPPSPLPLLALQGSSAAAAPQGGRRSRSDRPERRTAGDAKRRRVEGVEDGVAVAMLVPPPTNPTKLTPPIRRPAPPFDTRENVSAPSVTSQRSVDRAHMLTYMQAPTASGGSTSTK